MKLPENGSLATIALHAVTAGAFGYLLQRFALGADLQTSLIWAGAFCGGAGVLAWQQSKR